MKIFMSVVVVLGLGGGGWYWWYRHNAVPNVTFRTVELTHGDMIPTISATGTVEPLDTVDVGAQVAGQITEFGTDIAGKPIDFGGVVKKDALLAKIDPTLYLADQTSAQATLDAAKAAVKSARATRATATAQYANAKSAWMRAQELHPLDNGKSDAISENDYQTAKAAFGVAEANLDLGATLISQAEAVVKEDQALFDKAKKNVEYCTITSPVDGVIIDRRVNVGQTVVSSLSAPSLFLIAKDLTKIQVWVSVNEADINKIYIGQKVTFTVDALPGDTFPGKVARVRLNAQVNQNVVTYTVEVNPSEINEEIMPYMTANVEFQIAEHPNVLLVPNAALRWYPQQVEMVAPDVRTAMESKTKEKPDPAEVAADNAAAERRKHPRGKPSATTRPSTRPAASQGTPRVVEPPHGHGTIWITDGKYVRPVKVRTGYTDGVNTEITFKDKATELPFGTQVVVGEQHAQAADSETTNPFAPKINRRH